MVWFDQSLRFQMCNATISGWTEQWIPPNTKSPTCPDEIPAVKTDITGLIIKQR